jgi:hypothetical protein
MMLLPLLLLLLLLDPATASICVGLCTQALKSRSSSLAHQHRI